MAFLSSLEACVTALESVMLQILNMSITASYVILFVLLVRLLFRRLPKRYSYWLSAVAAFRLVCPVSVSSILSIFNIPLFDMTAAAVGSTLTYIPEDVGMMADPRVTVGIPALNAVISESLPAPVPSASVNPLQVWQALGTFLWVLGVLGLIICAAVSLIRVYRRVQGAVRIAGTEDVYECDAVRSPFVLGFFRPRIYLPFRLSERERAHVLAHERYHLRHGDHIVKPLAFLLVCIHWFNPLVWAAYACMCADMEMRCDEAVLGALPPVQRADYSMALLSLGTGRRFAGAGPLAFGETDVKRRIRNALSFKKPAAWIAAAATVLTVFIAAACGTNAEKAEVTPRMEFEGTVYAFDECLYMSVLSSSVILPGESTGELYQVTEDGLRILDEATGEILVSLGAEGDEWVFEGIDEEEFAALFDVFSGPDISAYDSAVQCRLGGGSYRLLRLDDEVWLLKLGTHGGKKAGQRYAWSIYRLKPYEEGGTAAPNSAIRFDESVLSFAAAPQPGRYATADGLAWVDLHSDGTFVFNRYIAMSYTPVGTWEALDGTLTLTVREDETYRFTVDYAAQTLTFEAGEYAATETGTEFIYQGDIPESWQWATEIAPSEEGVAEFLAVAGEEAHSTGYEDDVCYNVTPAQVVAFTEDYKIFKFDKSCATYLLYDGEIYPLGSWFGGLGLTDAALADLNRDGLSELYFTCSSGSGTHSAQAAYFDPAERQVAVFAYADRTFDSELVLRGSWEDIGVYTAELTGFESFVQFSLAPVKEVGRIAFRGDTIQFMKTGE